VLTGKGWDGVRGIEAILGRGGMAIIQDDTTAKAADMPRAAIDIGRAGLILPLDQIAFALEVLISDAEPFAAPRKTGGDNGHRSGRRPG
jgi:chemotaxis response regulator CheB